LVESGELLLRFLVQFVDLVGNFVIEDVVTVTADFLHLNAAAVWDSVIETNFFLSVITAHINFAVVQKRELISELLAMLRLKLLVGNFFERQAVVIFEVNCLNEVFLESF